MTATGFALFDTSIGRCGVVWGDDGIVTVQLPERSVAAMRARLRRFAGDAGETAPSDTVADAIEAIRDHLAGTGAELDDVRLDMSEVPDADRRVYELLRDTGHGSRTTYGQLARELGPPATPRTVGAALARNRFAPVVPCHRVVAADGRLGSFSAHGGLATKLRLLAAESPRAADADSRATSPWPLAVAPAIRHLRACDEVMAAVIEEHGTCSLQVDVAPSVFAALARAIVFQQLHTRAAEAIHARFLALLDAGTGNVAPRAVLAASAEELRAAGLSQAKIASLRDLARLTREGVVPTLDEAEGLDDETLIERVTCVRGVGRWTAQMLLIFMLGRPDVLPTEDFGVRTGFGVAYGRASLPAWRELDDFGRRWAPYRTVASWYLWRVAESAASTTQPA
jgi:methylated-DNA-[protein]-cysteine S-methyltransferase